MDEDLHVLESFGRSYDPGPEDFDQLVFALKYDGVDPCALKAIFGRVDRAHLASRIAAQPTSMFGRRLFFLFELLIGERLAVDDLAGGQYVPVLPPQDYYVSEGRRSTRHGVIDNLLGDAGFCPIVRKTLALQSSEADDLSARARELTNDVDPTLLARTVWYLYTKETRSTFAIEHEEPGDRTERFVNQLASVGRLELDREPELIALQNAIVQPAYRESRFRGPGDPEVYVGESIGFRQRIHHVGAPSAVTPELMSAWSRMRSPVGVSAAVVEAACRAFAFVFIHPFADGNGRIHRLLLHHFLARLGFFPRELVVPISSAILRVPHEYDRALEDFSRRVMPLTDYSLSEEHELTLRSVPVDAYRYPDLTPQCEATFRWLARSLEEDLVQELTFLRRYDEIRARIRDFVEMPDRKEQLFIELALQGKGRLSKTKRSLFAELSEETLARLEGIVHDALSVGGGLS